MKKVSKMATNLTNRNEWIFSQAKSQFNNKELIINSLIIEMLERTNTMFSYSGLPQTIRVKELETILQVGGFAIWAKDNKGDLYVFSGGLGGEPNPYYLPSKAIVANPALRLNKDFTIDKDCIVMLNDTYYQGLMPMFTRYASMLAETEISLKYATVNTRIPAFVQADNDSTKSSAEEFIRRIVDGDGYGVVATKEFFDGISSVEFAKYPQIKDLIEEYQYIKGSWYNAVGLESTFNMKREAINEAEACLNDDILHPTIDNMLRNRKESLEKVNEMFGTSITVELDGIWKQKRKQENLVIKQQENEVTGGGKDETV